jgi:hypothetical protein
VQYWEGPSTGVGKLIAFVAARLGADDSVMGENRLLRLEERPTRARRAARRKAMVAGKERTSPGTRAARPARKSGTSTARKSATKKTPRSPAKTATAKRAAAKKSSRATAKSAATKKAAKKTPRR